MTKKKKSAKTEYQDPASIGQIPPVQYWKWRLSIEEMQHSDTRREVTMMHFRLKEKEIENNTMQLSFLRNKIKEKIADQEKYKTEYDTIVKEIEEELNLTLKDCIIDEYTFEVKKLDP